MEVLMKNGSAIVLACTSENSFAAMRELLVSVITLHQHDPMLVHRGAVLGGQENDPGHPETVLVWQYQRKQDDVWSEKHINKDDAEHGTSWGVGQMTWYWFVATL
jgi:hypothetical protein